MPVYSVINNVSNVEVTRYAASDINTENYPLNLFSHIELLENAESIISQKDSDWYINVGPFFDRFKSYKIPILASSDMIVQAIVKDVTVRKYIDLKGRRSELEQALFILQSKGFSVNISEVLDTIPSPQEVFHG